MGFHAQQAGVHALQLVEAKLATMSRQASLGPTRAHLPTAAAVAFASACGTASATLLYPPCCLAPDSS